jgi:hypothetical protein
MVVLIESPRRSWERSDGENAWLVGSPRTATVTCEVPQRREPSAACSGGITTHVEVDPCLADTYLPSSVIDVLDLLHSHFEVSSGARAQPDRGAYQEIRESCRS